MILSPEALVKKTSKEGTLLSRQWHISCAGKSYTSRTMRCSPADSFGSDWGIPSSWSVAQGSYYTRFWEREGERARERERERGSVRERGLRCYSFWFWAPYNNGLKLLLAALRQDLREAG